MTAYKPAKPDRRTSYCPACKQEFLSYKAADSRCPRCGRPAHTPAGRRILRIAALVLLVALIACFVVAYRFYR